MDQTTKQIIRRLAKRQPRDQLLSDLCGRFRLKRSEADKLVSEIESRYAEDIRLRHRPFLVLQGVFLALIGFVLAAYLAFISIKGHTIKLFHLPTPYFGNAVFFILGLVAIGIGSWQIFRIYRK